MKTQTSDIPPREPPKVACGFESDEIEELAARIADLPVKDAVELLRYLEEKIK